MYDIASALRRRALAERLEDLQRAQSALSETATDRAPRPRHASEPTSGPAPTDSPVPTAAPVSEDEGPFGTTEPTAALAPEAADEDLREVPPAGSSAATIAELLRGGGARMFFDRGQASPEHPWARAGPEAPTVGT